MWSSFDMGSGTSRSVPSRRRMRRTGPRLVAQVVQAARLVLVAFPSLKIAWMRGCRRRRTSRTAAPCPRSNELARLHPLMAVLGVGEGRIPAAATPEEPQLVS